MVASGVALVPTVMQLDKFPEYAEAGPREVPGVRRPHDRPARAVARDTIMAAHEAGVPLYAGTDGGGVLAARADRRRGARAGRARPQRRRTRSGRPRGGRGSGSGCDGTLAEGTAADFVVFARDPLDDLGVLRDPPADRAARSRRSADASSGARPVGRHREPAPGGLEVRPGESLAE